MNEEESAKIIEKKNASVLCVLSSESHETNLLCYTLHIDLIKILHFDFYPMLSHLCWDNDLGFGKSEKTYF